MSFPNNILFLNHVTFLGGAELYLVSIFNHLDRNQFKGHFISQEPGDLTTEAERANVKVDLMKLRGWRKLKYYFHNRLTVKKLSQYCLDHEIKLICSNCYRVTPFAVEAAKRCGIPVITNVQDFIPEQKLRNFKVFDCDRLVTVSDAIKKSVQDYYNGPIDTIYNGIDIARFEGQLNGETSFREEFGITDGMKVVGMVGHVLPWKRHKDFLNAMKLVSESYKDVIFIIVGDALYPHELTLDTIKDFARDIKLNDRVIFTGERSDVSKILKGMDVFVQSSSKEAFSRVLTEAMVMRKPVVATKCGGPEEIVEDEVTGHLVSISDTEAMADRVLSLLYDDEKRETMGARGRKRVEDIFTPEKTVARINNIFIEAINAKG